MKYTLKTHHLGNFVLRAVREEDNTLTGIVRLNVVKREQSRIKAKISGVCVPFVVYPGRKVEVANEEDLFFYGIPSHFKNNFRRKINFNFGREYIDKGYSERTSQSMRGEGFFMIPLEEMSLPVEGKKLVKLCLEDLKEGIKGRKPKILDLVENMYLVEVERRQDGNRRSRGSTWNYFPAELRDKAFELGEHYMEYDRRIVSEESKIVRLPGPFEVLVPVGGQGNYRLKFKRAQN